MWSCANGHKTGGKYHSSHLVALYMPFAFSLWMCVNDCLRSLGPDLGLFLSHGQGSDYPLFSSDAIPSGTHGFHQVQKNPTPSAKVSQQKKDSVANRMNPRAVRWKDGRDFCRPAVQKTKLLDVYPYPFSDPWPKVSVRQWLGASCHKGRAPFSAHTF